MVLPLSLKVHLQSLEEVIMIVGPLVIPCMLYLSHTLIVMHIHSFHELFLCGTLCHTILPPLLHSYHLNVTFYFFLMIKINN